MSLRVVIVIAAAAAGIALQLSGIDRLEARQAAVVLRHDAAASQVAVAIDGRPFTSYRYGAAFPDKPVFYPVMSPNGVRVNREYPMTEGVAGESTDHPHHQSVFFAHDEVNGTHFWNPSTTARRIEHRDVHVEGRTLVARLAWRDGQGAVVLEETKRVTFGGAADVWWMDHEMTLEATRVSVTLGDTKEGTFAIRLNDRLKEAGGSGRYVNAEGLETEKGVWGRTSDWVAIRGTIDDGPEPRQVTVAIFAPRSGHNAPPYWHARAYGLFAVNSFGRHSFEPSEPERVTRLATGDQIRLRFRLAVYAGQVSTDRLANDYAQIR